MQLGFRDLVMTTLGVGFSVVACGSQPLPAEPQPDVARNEVAPGPRQRAKGAGNPEDCRQVPGKPAPKGLRTDYDGVAGLAECDRQVFTIMGGVRHALGVDCGYCHQGDDYPAMTHRKRVANWMARELVPALRMQTGEDVWCVDCHHDGERGTPHPLGKPRTKGAAIEWMNTVLVEKFERADGKPLRCKACHDADIGQPGFKAKLVGSDLFGDGPSRPAVRSPDVPAVSDPGVPPDSDVAADAGAD